MPLSPEQERALTASFEPIIKLLSNSVLPDYVPGIKSALNEFIEGIKFDCDDGCLSFDEAQQLANHLRKYIEHAIKLNRPELNVRALWIRNFLKYQCIGEVSCYSKGRQLMGLIFAGCTFASFWFMPYLTGKSPQDIWSKIGPLFALAMVSSLGGLVGTVVAAPMVARWSIKGQFTGVTNNIHSFLNKMSGSNNQDEPAKNYFQLADKIFNAVRHNRSHDYLITLINSSMQNMYAQDKVVRGDIENEMQGKFLQRLLDVYVNANFDPEHKVTLRTYLRTVKQPHVFADEDEKLTRKNSRLAEIEGVINNELLDLTKADDSEHEAILNIN